MVLDTKKRCAPVVYIFCQLEVGCHLIRSTAAHCSCFEKNDFHFRNVFGNYEEVDHCSCPSTRWQIALTEDAEQVDSDAAAFLLTH